MFRDHALQFGFFLDEEHFARVSALPPNDPSRPCDAMIAVACLWGCHFSPPGSPLRSIEVLVLAAALHDRAVNLIRQETNARRVLHILQAEILLAYYYLRQGILIEAQIHANTAASIARGSGLHGAYAAERQAPRELWVSARESSYLPAPRNAPESGELINGFWATYVLVQHMTSFSPTLDNDYGMSALQIDCPWPLSTQSYRDVCVLKLHRQALSDL